MLGDAQKSKPTFQWLMASWRWSIWQRASLAGIIAPLVLTVAAIASSSVWAAPDSSAPAAAREGGIALARGDTATAISNYTAALADKKLPNDRRAMILNDRAVAYARVGKTKNAFDDFNEALQLFPEYAAIYNNRGNLLLALGLPAEAVKDFDRALVLAPEYAAAYNNRAGAHMRTGELSRAIEDYTRAVKLLPSGAAPLSGRGLAHLELGRPHAAIRDFSRAVNSDASFASGYRNRAEAKIAVGHYDEAIEDLSRAVAFDMKNADMYRLRAYAYLVTGNAEAAVKDYTRAIELRPNEPSLYAERGLAHSRDGNKENALADLGYAIERDPRSAVAFAYRGYVYKEMDQADVGMKDIDRAVKLDPASPRVLWAKAEVEDAFGQHDQAIADLKRALLLDPGMKLAADSLERLDSDAAAIEEKPLPGLGFDGWEVVARGNRFFAVNTKYRRITVPLEMFGKGQPKIIAWDLRPSPLKHIGVLTFSGGEIKGKSGMEPTEFSAILNVSTSTVVAIEPNREGKRTSTWSWSDNKVSVASVDGVTDEFELEPKKPRVAKSRSRQYSSAGNDPWADPWASPRQRPRRRSGRRRKPKTLFDLLFNN